MTDVIKLVKGDAYPTITLTLTDEDSGDPIDVSALTTTVYLKFRAAGSTTLIDTITCAIVDGANGIVSFDFVGGALADVDAGLYEGEIEIDFSGSTHTIWDVLKFRVRDEF